MIKKNNQTGFTLIEVVIVLGISMFILFGLLTLFDWHGRIYSLEQADVRATSSARTALNNMSDAIAQGTYIQSWRTVSGTTYTTDSHTLVLEMPTIDSTGNFVAGSYDYIIYYLSNGNLYQLSDFAASSVRKNKSKLLAEGVQTFNLTYNAVDVSQATTITIDLITSIQVRGTTNATAHVNDTVLLRNHT
jgi:Tfp pilus assembly protein PilW